MTRARRRTALVAGALVAAAVLGVCSVRPRPEEPGAERSASPTRSPPPAPRPAAADTGQSSTDDPADLAGLSGVAGVGPDACAAERREAAELAIRTAGTCGEAFERGLCPPPVAFPAGSTPETQLRKVHEAFEGCGLEPGELLVECDEYPCITVFSRGALERQHGACETLGELFDLAPSAEDHVADLGQVWADWVPGFAEVPDPEIEAQVVARNRNRAAALGRRLEALEAHEALGDDGRGGLPSDCDRVHRALTGLRSASACDVLREYWDCPPADAPISDELRERYEQFAEQRLEELVRTCPHLSEDNTLLDCSGVPCTIVADVGSADLGDGEAFCGTSGLTYVRSGGHPTLRIGVVFLGQPRAHEAVVRETFAREQRQRVRDALQAWEASQP